MPDPKKLKEKFIQNLKMGIPAIESGGGNYKAQNPDSTAVGKYQFLKMWLDSPKSKLGIMNIRDFAKSTGVFDDVNSMEDFKNNPELQDAYFEYYAGEFLFPKAEELVKDPKNNPLGLSIDEIGAVMHYQGGSGGKKIVMTGKLPAATKKNADGTGVRNVSVKDYLKTYNGGLKKNNANNIAQEESMDPKSKDEVWKEYSDKKDNILYNNQLPEATKRSLLEKLNMEYYKKGYISGDPNKPGGIINEKIKEANEAAKKDYEKRVQELGEYQEMIESMSFEYVNEKGKEYDPEKDSKMFIAEASKFDSSLKNPKYTKKFAEEHPNIFKKHYDSNGIFTGRYKINKKELLLEFQKKANNLLPEENHFEILKENGEKGKSLNLDPKTGLNILQNLTPGDQEKFALISIKNPNRFEFNEFDQGIPYIPVDPTWDQKIKQREKAKETSTTGDSEKTPVKADNEIPVQEEETDITTAEDYFNLVGDKPQTGSYDPDQFKDNFPFADVITSAAGIFTGMIAAGKKTPRRDEKVSNAFLSYTAELKRLSEIGLTPEEEAYAKNNLAEAYQSGIENIVRASGGNRNTVLGNLGRLDLQKANNLMNLSLADVQEKRRALGQYGEAIKYINEFDARRDIANNERDYNEALMGKQAGANLAAQSFQNLLNNIQYYKENKPGSANHMFKSYMYREMFEVDPTIKDDGSGTVPYTLSWKDAKDQKSVNDWMSMVDDRDKFNSLNRPEKELVSNFMQETNYDTELTRGFLNYVHDNDQLPTADFGKINEATKANDWSLLFTDNQPTTEVVEKKPQRMDSFMFENPFDTTVIAPKEEEMMAGLPTN